MSEATHITILPTITDIVTIEYRNQCNLRTEQCNK